MDWWSRLMGGTHAPKRPQSNAPAHDPQLRLARFKRLYHTVLQLCNRPRNLSTERPLFDQLHGCLQRISTQILEEARAPAPHLLLQFAASNQIYAVVARAAIASQHEAVISSAVAIFAALVDSEEEDYLSSAPFAKSLMRLVTKVADAGNVLVSVETETAILELLFTIAAKIRLQPDILPVWFQSTAKPELEDVFVKEKKSFVGITQKEDFPLCYLLIDRVHHEGRIGDFARTGLLYIFEATGRSLSLEEWVVTSDLPTLMASGLGALYSQLSRELSILHPDATLPAVLAMSDYTTTHPRATAESAFSESHQSHMTTFLSYLAFWQDILDHCRSADVRQTLLDHFQILFLQQLLYPSLLQSSDTDAGSSVAVLTYMTAMMESLEYPDLMRMILAYLLAIQDDAPDVASVPATPITPSNPPPSPTTLRRRQSLMLIAAPKNPDDAVEPSLFNLVDLILNNVTSRNGQSVFAALKLASTILSRQTQFAFGSLLKVQKTREQGPSRTIGALHVELDRLKELAISLHDHYSLDEAYAGLADDARFMIESQVPFQSPTFAQQDEMDHNHVGRYRLLPEAPLVKALLALLRTFFTNGVDVNLALTQTIVSIALCVEIRLDAWLAPDRSSYNFSDEDADLQSKPWQSYLDKDEANAFSAFQKASRRPLESHQSSPMLHHILQALAQELENVRIEVPSLDQLISGRKTMLQAASLDTPLISSRPQSAVTSPIQDSFLEAPKPAGAHSRSSSQPAAMEVRNKATNLQSASSRSLAGTPTLNEDQNRTSHSSSPFAAVRSIFLPPPPETPSTTDVLMQKITFPAIDAPAGQSDCSGNEATSERTASLNHVLTNAVLLQEFVLELVAVMQVRAAVLGDKEVRFQ